MERGRGEEVYVFGFFSVVLSILKPDISVSQVFRFVQNLIGCEEQARVFKDEVSATLVLLQFFDMLLFSYCCVAQLRPFQCQFVLFLTVMMTVN